MEKITKTGANLGLLLLTLTFQFGCSDDSTKLNPVLTWADPADIKFGTPLSEEQLNATADVAGTFEYSPELGTVLEVGDNQVLLVTFLPSETEKYESASATVTINVISNGTSSAVFNSTLEYGVMTDTDGNSYKTIVIGTQTWMAENLRTTKYRNGDDVPEVTGNAAWKALTTGASCTYENTTDLDAQATYGRLYNWFAVNDSRNLAPEGWHVATEADWAALATQLGGLSVAGGKIKETGTTHWNAPNTSATNSAGFTALPAGRREFGDGSFINTGFNSFWWTSSPYNPDYSWYYQVNYDFASIVPANFHKQYGFSVRCVKD